MTIRSTPVRTSVSAAASDRRIIPARHLVRGEELTEKGNYSSFSRVRLRYPPVEQVPFYVAGLGPKMLELSGEVADGTLLSVLASPQCRLRLPLGWDVG